jgi:hypothetical protein
MSSRRLKVYYRPGASSSDIPQMRIGGAWLARHGFNVGDHIELAVEEEHITIRRIAVEEPEPKRKR